MGLALQSWAPGSWATALRCQPPDGPRSLPDRTYAHVTVAPFHPTTKPDSTSALRIQFSNHSHCHADPTARASHGLTDGIPPSRNAASFLRRSGPNQRVASSSSPLSFPTPRVLSSTLAASLGSRDSQTAKRQNPSRGHSGIGHGGEGVAASVGLHRWRRRLRSWAG